MSDQRQNNGSNDGSCLRPGIRQGGRCVILQHFLPDGSAHFDWLLESARADSTAEGDDARTLLAFRIGRSPDELHSGQLIDMQSIALHRRLYLHYEGSLSGGRGEVRRVRAGVAEAVRFIDRDTRQTSIRVRWEDAPDRVARLQEFTLERDASAVDRWRLCCVQAHSRAE